MEKTIKIGKQEVRISNNISWAMIYRDQFGRDIIPALTPMIAAVFDVASGLIDDKGVINTADILRRLDGDKFLDAVIHLSGLEFVDFINIFWSMAKVLDDDIPEPKKWVREFSVFPLDEIMPAVALLIGKGMVSSKNWKRLANLLKTSQPLTLIQSSSQESKED